MTNLQIIVNALNQRVMNDKELDNIAKAKEIIKDELSTFLNYDVTVHSRMNSLVVNVSCFSLSFYTSSDSKLNLTILTTNPSYVGLNYERHIKLTDFKLDWYAMYEQFKSKMDEWHTFELSKLEAVDDHFVRPNNGLKVKVSGFAGGCFGTGLTNSKSESVGRTSYLEAKLLADKFGKEKETEFQIVSNGQRPDTPFWEYQLNYSLTPKVEEVIINNETYYRFKEQGKNHSYKVVGSTMFGKDIRVDAAYYLENELTFKGGVASYATDVIGAYINRNNLHID